MSNDTPVPPDGDREPRDDAQDQPAAPSDGGLELERPPRRTHPGRPATRSHRRLQHPSPPRRSRSHGARPGKRHCAGRRRPRRADTAAESRRPAAPGSCLQPAGSLALAAPVAAHRASTPSGRSAVGGRGAAVGCLVIVLVLVGSRRRRRGSPCRARSSSSSPRRRPPADYEGVGTGDVNFVIKDGDIGADIAQNLHADGVTASFGAFYDLLLTQKPGPGLPAGRLCHAQEDERGIRPRCPGGSRRTDSRTPSSCPRAPRPPTSTRSISEGTEAPARRRAGRGGGRRLVRAAGRGDDARGLPVPGHVHLRPRRHGSRGR